MRQSSVFTSSCISFVYKLAGFAVRGTSQGRACRHNGQPMAKYALG